MSGPDAPSQALPHRELFESNPLPMLVYDLETLRFLAVNAAAVSHYGYSRERFSSMTIRDIRPQEDIPALERNLAAQEAGYARSGLWRHVTADGRILHVEISSHDVRFDERPARLVLAHDVTARVEAEVATREALEREREARAHFRALFEAAPGMYLVLTPEDLRIVAVSDSYLRATRTERDQILGRHLFDVFAEEHPADPEAQAARVVRASLGRVRASGRPDTMPVQRYPIARPEAEGGGWETRYWSSVNVPVPGPDGRPLYIIHRTQDVTEFVEGRLAMGAGEDEVPTLETPAEQMEADVILQAMELHRQKEFLEASLDQFRRAFEGAAVAIAIVSVEGRFQEVNPAYCRMVGYSEEELLGRDFFSITHPDDVGRNRTVFTELIEGTRDSFVMEKRFVTKSGETAWGRISVSALQDERGRPSRVVGVCEDITERRRAEAEAGRLQDRMVRTLESITDAFFTLDREWRFVYVNREAETLLRRSRDELLGRVVWDEFPQAVGSPFQIEYERAMETGSAVQFEGFYPPLETWFAVHAYPSEDGLAVYFHDVTEARKARTALAESEARYRSLIEASPDAIFVQQEGRVVMANPATARLFGAEGVEDLVGLHILELVHPEQREVVRERSRALHRGEVVPPLEERLIRLDGSQVEAEVVSASLSWNGRPAVQVIARDVTEKKELQARFLRAQRLESIGTLAGGIAHDLNNMLAPILMSVSLMRAETPPGPARELLDTIDTSARRGAALVKQVLSFARGVQGERRRIHPGEVVAGIESIVRETFPRNIRLTVDVAPDVNPVTADPTQMHQVLLNLCVNARDALEARGGEIRLSVRNVEVDESQVEATGEGQAGPHVVFTVEDTGEGIAPEILDQVFDPFFTTKELGRGTGLGLPTAMAIVQGHGGFMTARSRDGAGAVFQVFLPAEEHREEVGPAPTEAPDSAPPRGRGELVLVVDDEEAVRTVTRRTLETFGYRAATAPDGQAATDYVRANMGQVELVLTDVNMPNMGGAAVVGALEALDPGIPIVLTSGLEPPAGLVGEGAGARPFLAKPYTSRELLTTLARALGRDV